jgi:hypothetical protein
MSAPDRDGVPPRLPGGPRLLFAAAGASVAYAIHLLAGVALVDVSCALGSTWPLHAATVALLLVALASTAEARRIWRAASGGERGIDWDRRVPWTAMSGLLLGGTATVLIVLHWSGTWFYPPC